MKVKFIVSAFLIAVFAALGMSRGALADGTTIPDVSAAATDAPICKPISNASHMVLVCTDRMTVEVQKSKGIQVSLEAVPEDMALLNAPGVNFIGPATIIKVTDAKGQPVKTAFMQICFKDFTKANIFRWWPTADWKTYFGADLSGRWVYTTTTHNVSGLSCTSNWLPGIFTIN